MYKKIILLVLACFLVSIINGCAIKTYKVTRERVDQDLSKGNRGYLMGKPEVSEEKPRKTTRQLQVIEMEYRPIRMGIKPRSKVSPAIKQIPAIKPVIGKPAVVMKKYTVRKGDTLQRIAQKFYGTTKRWKEIYKANQKILKTPDSIYPGQIIKIPVEEVAGTK
jgi:nucleoid-associated protein YgaU